MVRKKIVILEGCLQATQHQCPLLNDSSNTRLIDLTVPYKSSHNLVITIPVRKPLIEVFFLLNWAKDLFRWGTEAIMIGCSF